MYLRPNLYLKLYLFVLYFILGKPFYSYVTLLQKVTYIMLTEFLSITVNFGRPVNPFTSSYITTIKV